MGDLHIYSIGLKLLSHALISLMQVDDLDIYSIGPKFEKNSVFPAKTNTEVRMSHWLLSWLGPWVPFEPYCGVLY